MTTKFAIGNVPLHPRAGGSFCAINSEVLERRELGTLGVCAQMVGEEDESFELVQKVVTTKRRSCARHKITA